MAKKAKIISPDLKRTMLALAESSASAVEIMRPGIWNKNEFTLEDLEEMVRNAPLVGFGVPLKMGHKDYDGQPACGWAENLRMEGEALVADFNSVPDFVAGMIRDRAYDAVSAEIFLKFERNGVKFGKALKAVALLGAETPAVSGLKPLSQSFTDEELSHVAKFVTEEEAEAMPKTVEELQAELDVATAKLAEETAARAALEAKVKPPKKMTEEAEVAALKQKLADAEAALTEAKKGAPSAVELARLNDEVVALRRRDEEREEETRKSKANQIASSVRVPWMRPHILALAELATRPGADGKPVVVKFKTETDGKKVEEDVPVLKIVEDLVTRFNEHAAKLFSTLGKTENFTRAEGSDSDKSPGEVLDEKANALLAADPKLGYQAAFARVLADPANAELKERYAFRADA